MTHLLTRAEVIGIRGDEPPLTAADIDIIARRYYTPAQAAAALTGDRDRARNTACGSAGLGLAYMSDARGLWARVNADPDRGGHVPWRTLEDVLRCHATPPAVRLLADAVAAHTAHVVAHAHAWTQYRYGPNREEGDPPKLDTVTDSRLHAAARRALAALLDGVAVQLDLFSDES